MEPAGSDLDGDHRQEFPHGPLLADLFGWSPGAENLPFDLCETKGKLTFQWQRITIRRNLKKFRPFLWESYIFILFEKPMGKRVLCRERRRR